MSNNEFKQSHGIGQSVDHNRQTEIPEHKRRAGSIRHKQAIHLGDHNNTVIYIRPGRDPEPVREKYLRHLMVRPMEEMEDEDETR